MPLNSYWHADRWKSSRLIFRLSTHWSDRTWPPISAGDCRAWWLATLMENTWIGTHGWVRDGRNYYLILPTRTTVWSLDRTPNHQPIQTLCCSQCLGHCDNPETLFLGVSDFVLCTQLGSPPGTHGHLVSLILSTPTGSPWFQAHWLDQLPN